MANRANKKPQSDLSLRDFLNDVIYFTRLNRTLRATGSTAPTLSPL